MARPRQYTTHDVARLIQVDPSTVAKWIDADRLVAFRTPGGHRRIRQADLVAFLGKYGIPIPEELDQNDGDSNSPVAVPPAPKSSHWKEMVTQRFSENERAESAAWVQREVVRITRAPPAMPLAAIRAATNLTVQQIARRLGVPARTLASSEKMDLDDLEKMPIADLRRWLSVMGARLELRVFLDTGPEGILGPPPASKRRKRKPHR